LILKREGGFVIIFTDGTSNMSWRTGHGWEQGWSVLKESAGFNRLDVAYLTQVHGATIREVKRPGYQGPGDGMFTKLAGVALAVFTADCMPLIAYHEQSGYSFALHCGWRSLAAGILDNLLRIVDDLELNRNALKVFIGPCIRGCCYRVGREFMNIFPEDFLRDEEDGLFFDMVGLVKNKFSMEGIDRVEDTGVCTCCSGDYFSHRCRGSKERQVAVVIKEVDF